MSPSATRTLARLALAAVVAAAGACAKKAEHPPEISPFGDLPEPTTCDGLNAPDAGARATPDRRIVVDGESASCFVTGSICPLAPTVKGTSCDVDAAATLVVAYCAADGMWVERCLVADAGAHDAESDVDAGDDAGEADAPDERDAPDDAPDADDAPAE